MVRAFPGLNFERAAATANRAESKMSGYAVLTRPTRLSKEQRLLLDDSVRDAQPQGREQTFAEVDVADLTDTACPSCHGTRLNATARAVRFAGVSITKLARLSVSDLRQWVETLQQPGRLSPREADIARDLLPEIRARLEFLQQVGLGYLTLDRGAPTLSGGEAQRSRLAAQLGSNLQGVCYVLDEPTIGLHGKRLAAITKLAFDVIPQDLARAEYRQGNTVGHEHKHWFRAKFFQQYRLFFRYHAPSEVIVFQRCLDPGA